MRVRNFGIPVETARMSVTYDTDTDTTTNRMNSASYSEIRLTTNKVNDRTARLTFLYTEFDPRTDSNVPDISKAWTS